MKTKLLWLLVLLSLLFSAFPGICLAEKDYSPYVIEVQVSAGDTKRCHSHCEWFCQ